MKEEHSVIKNHFLKIFRHMRWADLSVIDLLVKEKISQSKVLELISHIVITEETWYKRIMNEPYENRFWNVIPLEECKRIAEQTYLKFTKYITELAEKDFHQMIAYKNSKGVDFITSVADILTHVAMHSMYHRGQIMLAMRESGKDVVSTDYAMYIREEELADK